MKDDAATLEEAVAVEVSLPMQEAWQRLEDFSAAHHYVPRLTATEIVSEQRSGVGAQRRVYSGRRYLEETVFDWQQGSGFAIALHKGARPMPPFRRAEFEYALAPVDGDRTRVELTMRVSMPGGFIGRLMARSVIMPLIRKNLVQVAAGLKHYYESGNSATDADRARLTPSVTVIAGRG